MKTLNPDRTKTSTFAGLYTTNVYIASAQSLEGKNYLVKMYDTGNPDQSIDNVLIFSSSTFESEACRSYGYQPVSYKVKKNGKGIIFTAATQSDQDGEMYWQGTITNDQIQGTAIWKKEGQDDIQYKFEGRQKQG